MRTLLFHCDSGDVAQVHAAIRKATAGPERGEARLAIITAASEECARAIHLDAAEATSGLGKSIAGRMRDNLPGLNGIEVVAACLQGLYVGSLDEDRAPPQRTTPAFPGEERTDSTEAERRQKLAEVFRTTANGEIAGGE